MIAVNFDNNGTGATREPDDDTVWYEMTMVLDEPVENRPIHHEEMFHPPPQIHRTSQIARARPFPIRSGCPPMNRGRHWNR